MPAVKRYKPYRIAFRVDGNHQIGLGHVFRCVNLADMFAAHLCVEIKFFTRDGEKVKQICGGRYPIEIISTYKEEEEERLFLLFDFYRVFQPHLIITDCQDTTSEYMKKVNELTALSVNFDDLGSGREHCSVLIDANLDPQKAPPGPQTLCGPRYIALHSQFSRLRKPGKPAPKQVKRVLISMGGGDPLDLTGKVIEALQEIQRDYLVVVGSGYPRAVLTRMKEELPDNFTVRQGVDSLAPFFAAAELAVIAGGITLYEALCMGVPALVLTQNEHQEVIAGRFSDEGAICHLGKGSSVTPEEISKALRRLMADRALREKMSEAGMNLVDGRGMERIFRYLNKRLK